MPVAQSAAPAPQPSETYLSPKVVTSLIGVTRRCIWRWQTDGSFPKPIRINGRVVRFKRSEIDTFLTTQQA